MEQDSVDNGKRGRIWSILGLLFFLIGLPYGSYVYLKKGYDYQKDALSQLRKDQLLPAPTGLSLLWGEAPASQEEGTMHIVGLLPASAGNRLPDYGNLLQRLHQQFDAPANIEFWTILESKDSAFVSDYRQFHALPVDTAQLLFWTASPEAMSNYSAALQLTEEEKAYYPEGIIVLTDIQGYVRKAYRLDDEAEVKQLVGLIAMLLPERKKEKPVVRREAER
ncbi:MAG: hypothetical protein R2795_21915 [Saprospiraceae bacterium]